MRITKNTGLFRMQKGADIASGNNISIPGGGNVFVITGTTQINTIAASTVSPIFLQFASNPTVKHATAGTGAQLQLSGASDFVASSGDVLCLLFDGTTWREFSRTVI